MKAEDLTNSGTDVNEEQEDLLAGIDFGKIWSIIQKSWFWLLLLPFLCLLGGYLFLRYTTPIYESASNLKLEIRQEATDLGLPMLNPAGESATNISGEIELIRSSIIYDEVIKQMDLGVSYYAYGRSRIKNEERYGGAPIKVSYEINNPLVYNIPFDITILNKDSFTLSYTIGGVDYSSTYTFGVPIKTSAFNFTINKTPYYLAERDNGAYYFTINSHDALSNYIGSNLRVEVVNPSANIIGVFFKDASIRKAQDIVNKIDTVYLEKTKELKNKANKQKIEFLDKQINSVEKELEAYESDLEKFVISNKSSDITKELERYSEKLDELTKVKTELLTQISILNSLNESLTKKKDVSPIVSSLPLLSDTDISALITELNKISQDKAMLSKSYRETTYAIQSKDLQISTTRNSLISLIGQKKKVLNERLSILNNEIGTTESSFAALPSKSTDYNRVKRLRDLKEKYHLLMIDKKAELGIAEAGTKEDFVILAPASLPFMPISPNKWIVYASCLFAGIIFNLILIGTKYLLHDTISSQKELEHATVAPVLGVIPIYMKEKLENSRLLVYQNPKSSISEAFRSVRTNLDFMFQMQQKKRIITVTSTISGEGKTFVSLNLAGVIALSSARVVLLDLDMRRPKVHLAFEEENYNGVSTLLIGKHSLTECIRKTPIENLDFIAAGPTPPNPSELILRPEFDNLLKELHQSYDVIVIDTPPIGLVTDGILVMRKADLPIYVLRADYSKRVFVKNINKLIKNNNFSKLAVVLNAFRNLNTYGYGYGYGYGYNEYYENDDEVNKGLDKLKGLLVKNK
ncbi:polysaccharide biosynthesis tyrosine autokinase [Cytophagaceae bacterium DM2B3-1]|uniref:non-specific protein-tyrosine kinase n=1 Tax=Xanthocytophaga flava TaxID=3048013 RepID=A0ABT7CJX2_9BACT|nr:polysaccharide biosynthesis tyrosine autokinase [Xanthocytophaga flavus]MDJ1468442.1 polysaccharide biosynthesis tyrosine autokinase [Xanthocytophaga flavus]MDJ1493327.1 polysaccharide biosynthesis tyrosine autokinase [Xanthocytophaga flavus]